MKRLLTISIVAVLNIVLLSCTKINEDAGSEPNVDGYVSEYTVPIDSALLYLSDFIQAGEVTRSSALKIENIQVVKRSKVATRMSYNNEDMLYLVKFAENQGSAVLAADSRIDAPVLALLDEGAFIPDDFEDPGYNNPNNLIINVDGEDFNLYCAAEDDYYIGSPNDEASQRSLVASMIESYAQNSIENSSTGGSKYQRRGNGEVVQSNLMLRTKWHQDSPFNDLTPIKGGRRSPAGCVAVALAQIMAYHEYPRNLTCNGVPCNWKEMKDYGQNPTSVSAASLANFISVLGVNCNMRYRKNYAFATPQAAKRCLSNFGYRNVKKKLGYNGGTILSMIDEGNPVFIGALSGLFGGGHAWVIDGYKYVGSRNITRADRDIYYGRRVGDGSYQVNRNTLLVHCNWGWKGGFCNGYYASGVFNIKNGPIELGDYDTKYERGVNENYNWWFRILTYDNPNN